ncbi:MAG: sugar ABC transporter substrate-binding protein, partial [Clostridiales bacterium]|nr:sugar ABC transporter substrate-binding protein [Clostridiales bacterium]
NYIPLGLTIEKGMENQWYTSGGTLNVSSGIAITKNCKDVEGAFKFIDDLLSQEIHDLRFWGVKDVDYKVDDNGLYYRTEEMRKNAADPNYKTKHLCTYSYFPQWSGTSRDGKNAMMPAEQPSEFKESLPAPVKKVFEAYGANTYIDILGSVNKAGPWYPMYSYSNNMKTDTAGGTAWTKMGECKHAWLPKVVMSKDFEKTWDEYMKAYAACKPEDFVAEMQQELDKRIAAYEAATKK